MNNDIEHIGIIGGGIIGLSIGWQLLRRSLKVTLYERDEVGSHASRVAAGMLAPYAEVGFEEVKLMKLGQESLRLYPRFLDELAEDCETVPTFDRCGTLFVGIDRDDTEYLQRLHDFRESLSLSSELMTGSKAREQEPLLSPRVVSGVWLPDDAQIDNRKLLKSLKEAFLNQGGVLKEHSTVSKISTENNKCTGVLLDGEHRRHDAVVIAAGSWTNEIENQPEESTIRPLKGQILTLRKTGECDVGSIIRSPRMYLVPKQNGTLRLGATSEEQGFDTTVTAGGMKEILEDGWEVVPSIYDLPVEEITAGMRPTTRDHLPLVGKGRREGCYYAAGHYRNGILLTPITAFKLTEQILEDHNPEILHPLRPGRFS